MITNDKKARSRTIGQEEARFTKKSAGAHLKKVNLKKFMAFVLLIPACGFLITMQSGSGGGKQGAVAAPGKAARLDKEAVMAKAVSLAVPFVPNAGRFNKQVRYSADLFSGRFFLTGNDLVYSLVQRSKKKDARQDKGLAFKEFFTDGKGSRISFKPEGEEKGATKVSYFRGNDPAKWQSGLASFNRISLGDIYPGIQVKLRASGKNVEKLFYVSPGSDVARIRIGVAGLKELKIAEDGQLLFKNSLGELAMRAPVAWQEIDGQHCEVNVSYRLFGKKHYGFVLSGEYDKNHPLVIDPALDILTASTFLGGSSLNCATTLVLDKTGNVYLAGYTDSSDFPTTIGAIDRKINPEVCGEWTCEVPWDIFISKLDRNLTRLLASTYLGGEDGDWYDFPDDLAYSLALDGAGNLLLCGDAASPDFPTTPGAYDRSNSDDGDAFISKLSSDLTTLLASTFIGGSHGAQGESMALDGGGNVYITGSTFSADFPTTPGAYDRVYDGSYRADVFISKLNGTLTTLLASTFLGGVNGDAGHSLALDGTGSVFVGGTTESPDFPTSLEAFDRTYNGGSEYGMGDTFISKLDGDLTTLLASTYLGGSNDEGVGSLALDAPGNVYLTGNTNSADFPTTKGAYDPTYNGSGADDCDLGDIYVSKLDNNLTSMLASTYLGGNSDERGNSLALDRAMNVYVAGFTNSPDLPTTVGAYDRTYNGGFNSDTWPYYGDAFISKLNRNLTALLGSTYLGGSDSDSGCALAVGDAGGIYLVGNTMSMDFPTTPWAYDRTFNSTNGYHFWWDYNDVFISKLGGDPIPAIDVNSPNGGESWVAGTAHNITWGATGKIENVRIELSADNGSSWSDVSVSPARYHRFPWTVSNMPSRKCLVRISDADNAATNDASDTVFSILMNIDLLAERREVRAFSIVRQYGRIQFLIGNASVPVAKYRIMRRKGSEDFALLKEIAPSQLQNNQFQMQDKYLEKGTPYTYRVEAYDAAGQLIGISLDKTI